MLKYLISLTSAIFFALCLQAQVVLTVTDPDAPPVLSGKFISYYEDSTTALPIDEVKKKAFTPSQTEILNFDVSTSAFWLRLNVCNRSNNKVLVEIENPLFDEIEFYLYNGDSLLYTETISKNAEFGQRSEKTPNYRFRIPSQSSDTLTCYIKCQSLAQIILPVNVGTYQSFVNSTAGKDFFSALYFGIMAIMLLYNFFLFLTVRDKNYFYYSLYIISVALVQLNLKGAGFMYVWPGMPGFEKFAVFIFSPLTAFASIAFIRHFLTTQRFTPKLHKGYWVFIVIYAGIIINALLGKPQISYNLLNVAALLLSLYMMYNATVIRIKYKYRPALFFLIAWSVFLGSIILFVMKDVGVLPYNAITVSVLQIGSAIEVSLLSFALADKINTLEKDRKQSQLLALNTAQENERIIKEQNIVLEQRVSERTKELSESNESLTMALNDLKQAQSQLVESEKMASLGQLTAGIAHEINNPINFVTSNVKPLQRDIAELYNLQERTEELIHNDAERMATVNKIKQELDYDYLKTEINYLLKGIHEGSSRTAEIVKGLRIFSRVDEDDIKLADINEGLESTIIIVNNQLNNRIEIEKSYDKLDYVECLPGKLNQVFLNLISNGIYAVKQKFGENEGGKISIATESRGDDVMISIADNGTGIDEPTKQKLFEPFFTTKPVGEGTGLGLSIVYNTIKKHNGTIAVNSVVGEGTTFVITIPKKQSNG
jgi:two-component system, NtrC family, sensor kinase